MAEQHIGERYFELLSAQTARAADQQLAEAQQLGRELMLAHAPPEEIVEIHEQALERLAKDSPDAEAMERVRRASALLVQILTTYGLASREQIDARKKADERLRSLARFPSEDPNPVLRVQEDGTIIYANEGSSPLFSAWGCGMGGLLPEHLRRVVSDVLCSGMAKDIEVACGERVLSICFAPVVEARHVNLYGLDVTKRKRAEEALWRSERYFRSLLHCMHEDVLVIDRKYEILDVNRAVLSTTGHSREDVVGCHCYEILHSLNGPCQERGQECMLPRVFESGEPRQCRHQHTRADGSKVWVDILLSPLTDAEGQITHVIEAARDVTELVEREEELRESREEFLSMVENISMGVALISPRMEVLELNRQMRGWFPNIKSGERPICHRVCNDPPLDVPCPWCPVVKTLQDGQVHDDVATKRVGKRTASYRIVSSPIRDAGGNIVAAIEMVEDVSEKRLLEVQLLQAQKMEAVGRLAGGVAHDFNNLLTGITGYAQLMLAQLEDGSPASRDLAQIRELAGRAAALTRQLLAFSRCQPLEPVVLNINSLVEKTSKLLQRIIGENIELEFRPAPDLGNLRADPTQIEQVLMNLVVNARDAMAQGGKLTIETANVTLDEDYADNHAGVKAGRYVMLAVTDTGGGIDEETRDHIFEPFFTTKAVGQGTGLGLATVYGIVKQHGGNIWVYSEVGRGTTFKVYLPRVYAGADRLIDEAAEPGPPAGSETVLIVEDDDVVSSVARRVLEGCGYTVLTAASSAEARETIAESNEEAALLLADVVLPGLSGPGLYKHLSADHPSLKVLYISGYADNAVQHVGALGRDAAFLQKPFTPQALATKVREVLDQCELKEQ